MRNRPLLVLALVAALPAPARADGLRVTVRGHVFPLPHVATVPQNEGVPVLFLPGDGGWRGFAITIAERMAAAGYDVYALDTRSYLEAFTGPTTLSPREVGADLAAITAEIGAHRRGRVVLVGWSEGAALVIAAAATEPAAFGGVVVFGVPEQGTLGWRLRDSLASLAGREPDEPQFDVGSVLSRIGSIPLVMIQATHDPFTPMERARALFNLIPGRKRLEFIEARNHRFDGGTERFFSALVDGLGWLRAGAALNTRRQTEQP